MLIVERRCNVGNLEGQNLSRVGLTISDACSNQQAYISGSYPKSWAKAHEPSDLTSPAAAPTRDQGLLSLLPSSFHTSFSHWRTVPGSLLAWEYGNGVYRLCAPVSSGGELRRWAQKASGYWVSTSHIQQSLAVWIWKFFHWHTVLYWVLCRLSWFSSIV